MVIMPDSLALLIISICMVALGKMANHISGYDDNCQNKG